MKKLMSALMVLCMLVGMAPFAYASEGVYTAGTYEARAKGFGGDVVVRVEVDKDSIVSVVVSENSETAGIGSAAIERMPGLFVEAGSAEVDGIAGCTFTSDALKEAVHKALNAAMGIEEAEVSTETTLTDGTYTATAVSFDEIVGVATDGQLTMNVTVEGGAIKGIQVPEYTDTDIIGGMAFEQMAQAVIENQSMAVDTLTGATVSSKAFLNVLGQCVQAAGGSAAALEARTIAKRAAEEATYDTQIVVVGAGMAGLCAAIEGVQQGAQVMLVEKQAVFSSSTTRSLGFVMGAGTELQKESGIEDTTDAFYEDIYSLYADELTLDTDLLRKLCADSTDLNRFLMDNGVKFEYVKNVSDKGARATKRIHVTEGGGSGLTSTLANAAKASGATVMMGTTVTGLIMEDGVVKGVRAINQYGDAITINADATILCAGSYTDNPELLKKLNPRVDNAEYLCGCGDGSSYYLGLQAGADIVSTDYIQMMFYFYSPAWTSFPEVMPGSPDMPAHDVLLLDGAGKRVCSEDDFCFEYVKQVWNAGYSEGYFVIGQELADKYPEMVKLALSTNVTASGKPFGYREDTIEALAARVDMDPATLTATIERYNALCAKGVDEDFGKAAEYLTPIEGPYYIVRLPQICTDGYTGVRINADAQVLSTEGAPIGGFYAAGSCASGQMTSINYFGCGTSLLTGGVYGRAAARSAISTLAK